MGRSVRKIKRKACKSYPLKKGELMEGIKGEDSSGSQQSDAIKYYKLGEECMEKGQFLKATAILEKSITLDPNCIEVSLKIGRCYEKLKRYEKAIFYYEKALELYPSSTEIRYSLGVSLQLLGLHKEAKEEYLKVLESDHNHIMARNNLAAVYLKEGEREKAVEAFKKLLEIEPHNHIFRRNLKIASGENSNSKKRRICGKRGISLCMVMRGEEEETKDFFKMIVPWVDEVVIVDTGERCDRINVAKNFKGKVFYHPWEEDFSTARNISLQYATCEWILVLNANEYISKEGFSLLSALIKNQDFEGFRFIQRNYCDNPSLSGWVPCTDGEKQAWNCCGWIPSYPVKMFRNHEDIFFEGIIKESVDRSIYRKGEKVGKANILVHHFDCFLTPAKRVAREKHLLELGKKQLALTPNDPGVYYDLALRYARLNEFEQAIIVFKELMCLVPDNYNAYNDLGNVYFGKEEYQTARDLYQKSLSLEPRFFQAHYNLANLHLLAGDLDSSWGAYHRALTIYPECAQIFNNLGIICEKRGKDEDAMRKCKYAVSFNPFLPQAYNNLGVLYKKKGDRLNAEKSYLKAIKLNTEYAEAYYNLGNLYLSEGEKDKAEKIFDEALKYSPALINVKGIRG